MIEWCKIGETFNWCFYHHFLSICFTDLIIGKFFLNDIEYSSSPISYRKIKLFSIYPAKASIWKFTYARKETLYFMLTINFCCNKQSVKLVRSKGDFWCNVGDLKRIHNAITFSAFNSQALLLFWFLSKMWPSR